ncbi:MAG TPA: hypothetical protein PLX33_06770 [Alphaproteobacteria bacterium]|nr:hypothetical protein [Alphaproteobacteria bacterium]
MKNLINITTSHDNPTFIDAHSVTGIHVFPEKGEMAIFGENGLLYALEMKGWNIDADDLLQKLAGAGNPLIALPLRHGGTEYPHFIAPHAVTFATITPVSQDGTQGIIAGVRGVGWEENYEATPAEVTTLLEAVRKSGKELMEILPDEAHARWSRPAALYIDPASVQEIRDDGGQVNVVFKASGSLDVQVNDPEYKISMTRAEEESARLALAAKIADAHGGLTHIAGASRAIYVTPDVFTSIRFHTNEKSENKYGMSLERPKTPTNPYPEAVRAYFNTAAARENSFNEIVAAAQSKPQGAAKPAKPRTP